MNHKRVHRIYREAGLALRRKKRKHCVRLSTPLGVYTAANQEWALDFVHDVTASGRSIRVLNVVDAYTRESLAMEVDTSFAGLRVTRVLEQIIVERGVPRAIRCDNGPELTSRHFLAWALDRKIDLVHIQPGKPTQNAYVESFNSKLREECLRVSWFQNLFEADPGQSSKRRDSKVSRSQHLMEPDVCGSWPSEQFRSWSLSFGLLCSVNRVSARTVLERRALRGEQGD